MKRLVEYFIPQQCSKRLHSAADKVDEISCDLLSLMREHKAKIVHEMTTPNKQKKMTAI